MTCGKILVFAKAPVPGQAKTRLIPTLGAEGAAELHALLLERTLNTVCSFSGQPVELWCTPDTKHDCFQNCVTKYPVMLRSQSGADLGARMFSALSSALANSPWTILVGCDCPDLDSRDISETIGLLEKGMDAVVGPAHDGGYYLLGLRKVTPALFADMPLGTDQVWSLTRNRLERLGWQYTTLRVQHDLDRPEDLRHFPGLLRELRTD